MSDIKTMHHSIVLLNKFLICPVFVSTRIKNQHLVKVLKYYGINAG